MFQISVQWPDISACDGASCREARRNIMSLQIVFVYAVCTSLNGRSITTFYDDNYIWSLMSTLSLPRNANGRGIVRNSTSGTRRGAGVMVKANLGTRPNVSSSVKSMRRGVGGIWYCGTRRCTEGGRVIGRAACRELPANPSVYHIDDSLANVKSLYLPSRDLSFIPRVNLPALRDNKSACIRVSFAICL